jgi:hypothetical protein
MPVLLTSAVLCGCAQPTPAVGPADLRPVGSGNPFQNEADLGLDASGDLRPRPDLAPCVDTRAPCSTGHPGACASGHTQCRDGALTCIPDVTTQPCYTGPAGTAGHGACVAGTQSCMGGLGACMGQVVPRTEDCFNNLDDNCNDRVDDGCPSTVTLGSPRKLLPLGGTGGTTNVSARCPAGSYVVRAQFMFDDDHSAASGVRIFCAAPTLVRGAGSYSVSLTPLAVAPAASFSGQNHTPPDEEVDCGTAGFVAGFGTAGRTGQYIYGFWLQCASGTVTLNPDNTLTYLLAKNGVTGSIAFPLGSPFEASCSPGEVLVGYDGRVGGWLDQLAPWCAPLLTTYKP